MQRAGQTREHEFASSVCQRLKSPVLIAVPILVDPDFCIDSIGLPSDGVAFNQRADHRPPIGSKHAPSDPHRSIEERHRYPGTIDKLLAEDVAVRVSVLRRPCEDPHVGSVRVSHESSPHEPLEVNAGETVRVR